jgi:hypothetical protein
MAEVHTEGNPHSSYYPEIVGDSFNLILKDEPQISEVKRDAKEYLKFECSRSIIREMGLMWSFNSDLRHKRP